MSTDGQRDATGAEEELQEPPFGNDSPSPTVDSGHEILDPGPEGDLLDDEDGPGGPPAGAAPASAAGQPASTAGQPAHRQLQPAPSQPARPAPASSYPGAEPDADEPWLRNFAAWAKAHPFFALFLFSLVFLVPWGLQELQRDLARRQVEGVLAGWEAALVAEGLPLPGLEPVEVDLPGELDPGQERMLQVAGATDRARALLAWADLRAGRIPAKLPTGETELRWLVQGCLVLHQAREAQGDAWLRELQKAALHVSKTREPLLRLGQALVEGRTAEALAEAEGIQAQGDPLVAQTVVRVVVDATARRLQELIATRPATLESLQELAHYAGRQPAGVRAALEQAPGTPWLALGGGDVPRGEALLGVFEALGGPEQAPAAAWSSARDDVLRVVVSRWSTWDQGYADAQALLLHTLRLDPQARFPLGGVLRDWRPLLQRLVNDQAALRALAVRLFEVGVVPPVLEDLSSLWVGQLGHAPATPGEALSAALARVVQLEGGGGDAEATSAAIAALEAQVAAREDWIAAALRDWVSCLRARLALAQGDPAAAEQAFAALLSQPRATLPAFRLEGWRARALLSLERWDEAAALAASALATCETLGELPESYREQDPRVAEALEAEGKPTERGAWVRLRAAALLDVVEAALGQGKPNAEAWAEAQRIADPLDPRLELVQARIAEAQGQHAQAGLRAQRALGQQPGPWVEGRLRALLERAQRQ